MSDLLATIESWVIATIAAADGTTGYGRPLLGTASAADPRFARLTAAVCPEHLQPSDLVPEAQGVLAFFLPFTAELIQRNRRDPYVAREWAVAYIETNALINTICQRLVEQLAGIGIKAAFQPPTHNFDRQRLVSVWSHRHVAEICGLGSFGLNHMLITPSGCAGRLGSLVLDQLLPPTPRNDRPVCRHFTKQTCLACVRRCPSGALTVEGLDRHRCYAYLLAVAAHFSDLGTCDVCGKCLTGPCALTAPRS